MQKIKTILFATSLSDYSRQYFAFTSTLAGQLKAKTIVLHVIEELQESYEGIAVAFFGEQRWREFKYEHLRNSEAVEVDEVTEEEIVEATIQELFREALDDGGGLAQFDHRLIIQQGKVADRILAQAQKHQCDLIIMGMSKGYLSGISTSPHIKTVIKKTQIPVIVIPPPVVG